MRFVTFTEAASYLRGKSVAVVGSAPSVLDNAPGFVDSHDVVLRVNNYKTSESAGKRCDVHYSFYGTSIKKTREQLIADGVRLCMCKCPNSKPLNSPWHEARGWQVGIDYRYIYEKRSGFWFCDTYIPDDDSFLRKFNTLEQHQPTSGMAAIMDVAHCNAKSIYLTGFDFFTSGLHNVDEQWRPGNPEDPIKHRPDLEMQWVRQNRDLFQFDKRLQELLE